MTETKDEFFGFYGHITLDGVEYRVNCMLKVDASGALVYHGNPSFEPRGNVVTIPELKPRTDDPGAM
jgi:hypothetical protein